MVPEPPGGVQRAPGAVGRSLLAPPSRRLGRALSATRPLVDTPRVVGAPSGGSPAPLRRPLKMALPPVVLTPVVRFGVDAVTVTTTPSLAVHQGRRAIKP